MNIRPQDLGSQFQERLLSQRCPRYGASPSAIIRCLGSRLTRASLLVVILAILFQWPLAVSLLVTLCVFGGSLISLPYTQLGPKRTDQLGEQEIILLRQEVQDGLAIEYLTLVSRIVSMTLPLEANAEEEVRQAIRALGTAIESLPDYGREVVAENPVAIRMEAARLEASLQTEEDIVIRASRQRRIESLHRRAETAAQTITLLRRHRALRDEVAEQIKALHTNLAAFSVSGRHSIRDLTGLAASIQSVTVEAGAITAARAEIDTLFSTPAGAPPADGETQMIHGVKF